MPERKVIIRLTAAQAALVYLNADGWMDAGSCEDGLRPDEHEALECLSDQIIEQIDLKTGTLKSRRPKERRRCPP